MRLFVLLVVFATGCQFTTSTRSNRGPARETRSEASPQVSSNQCEDAQLPRQSCDTIAACFGGWSPAARALSHLDCNGKCTESFSDSGLGDPMNCGTCGHACRDGQECRSGRCRGCNRNEQLCTFDDRYTAINIAFCADLQTNNMNCGKCGHNCPDGLSCIGGHCER